MVKAVAGKVALVTGGSRDIVHALMVRPMKSPAWLPIWPALKPPSLPAPASPSMAATCATGVMTRDAN